MPLTLLLKITFDRWKIKARVVQKAEIKHWHNARGEGKLFSVTLSDESGQIRATGFNEAVDQLYDRLVVGEVFYISRAKVTVAKKQFNNLPHDYEIMFENMTEVDEVSCCILFHPWRGLYSSS